MMPAAKWLDPLLGIDLHLIQPPGGPPLLVPHPSIGIVLDPFDLIPKFGANVFVNGLPRARAGSMGLMLPHFPLGGVFVVPPKNDLEIFMGSKTVSADGEAFSYLALPVLACQSVGMPPIPRPKLKKPKTSLGLVLPTAIVLAIPSGVYVDGPPTISLMALAFRAGFSALGKVAKGVKGMRRWKALSNRVHNLADKLARKLKLGDVARNRVHRAVCTVTGHPVDVATGKLFTESSDLELPGPLPFKFERVWYSTSTYQGPLGHGWHHSYDTALYVTPELILHRTSDGRVVTYPPLEEGEQYFERQERCTLVRDAQGYRIEQASGVTLHFALAPRVRLGAHASHRLARVVNRVGHRIELCYSEFGALREIVDSAGRSISFESDREGRLLSLALPHPDDPERRFVALEYRYDDVGNLTAVVDALGQTQRYEYERHLLARETDRTGLTFNFLFDARDETARCIRTWGDAGIYDRQIAYEPGVTSVVDSLGFGTRFEHAKGLVIRSVDALGAVRSTRYEHGQIVEWVDALGRTTLARYDERGNPVELVRADRVRLVTKFDARDMPVEMVDARGQRWAFRYDEWGQLVERRDPLGARTHFVYERGLLVETSDALGLRTSFEYDAHGNLTCCVASDRSATRFRYNALGWPVQRIDAVGNAEQQAFDLGGRLRRSEGPTGNVREFDYDGEGRPVRVADRFGEVKMQYGGSGYLVSRTQAEATVRFTYDAEERLLTIVNEHGALYSFERDALGAVSSERGFDGVARTYRRDVAGRVVRAELSNGVAHEYQYDALDHVVLTQHSDGTYERYSYGPDGVLVRAETETNQVVFEHDALGRVVRERQGSHWTESVYDALGRRTGLKSSFGLSERIERDVNGRVAALEAALSEFGTKAFAASFSRNSLGYELIRSSPGQVQSRWQRDSLGRPTQHDVSSPRTHQQARTYGWDVGNRLLYNVDSASGRMSYGYDAMGQLALTRHEGDRVEVRHRDAVGDVFTSSEKSDRRYGVAGQLLEAVDGEGRLVRYAYHPDGARSEKHSAEGTVSRYRWNARGFLIEVLRSDGVSTRFEYDAFGRRIAKHHRGKTTRWVWDEDVPLHEWVEESGHAEPIGTWIFEPESFAPMARLSESRQDYIVNDHLGTPVAMFDAAGDLTWSAQLDTWGDARVECGERGECPLRWPGQYEDIETGLYYNRFRYYDPEAGQYISQDPIGLAGGTALYAYVANPLLQSDPLGLDANFENIYPEDTPGNRYGVVQLEQRNGRWVEVGGRRAGHTARGLYDFVVIDGKVHAVPLGAVQPGRTKVGHVSIARGASVQYAGTVRFGAGTTTRGMVTAWDNGSGHFIPHPDWAHQAPFPRELFSAADFEPRPPGAVHGPQLPIIGHRHSSGCVP